MRIVISGNSIPIQIYPKIAGAKTFGQLLGYDVVHACYPKKTIRQAYENLNSEIICHFPDVIIVCYGIVECFPWFYFRNRMSRRKFSFYLERVIKEIRFYCDSKIILLGILPLSEYWGKRSQGAVSNIYSYNKIINETAKIRLLLHRFDGFRMPC